MRNVHSSLWISGATALVLFGGSSDSQLRQVRQAVPPAAAFQWRPEVKPGNTIRELNRWLKTYAESKHIQFVDYYGVLVNDTGGLKNALSAGVHPNREGYAKMRPLARAAIGRG